jgi:hypothetical protein
MFQGLNLLLCYNLYYCCNLPSFLQVLQQKIAFSSFVVFGDPLVLKNVLISILNCPRFSSIQIWKLHKLTTLSLPSLFYSIGGRLRSYTGGLRLDCILPRDSLKLLGKPPLCWIYSFTQTREVVAWVIVVTSFDVPLVLAPCKDFSLGCYTVS